MQTLLPANSKTYSLSCSLNKCRYESHATLLPAGSNTHYPCGIVQGTTPCSLFSLLHCMCQSLFFVSPLHVLTFVRYVFGTLLCSLICTCVTNGCQWLHVYAPAHYLALYFAGMFIWCDTDVDISLSRLQLMMFHFYSLCRGFVYFSVNV